MSRAVPALLSTAPSGLALPGLLRTTVAVTEDGAGIAEDVIALLKQAGVNAVQADEADGSAGVTIFLGGLRPDADDIAVTREAFHVARTIAGSGAFVTVSPAGLVGPSALARTCAREWPEVAVKAIEIEYSDIDSVASSIVTELLLGDSEADVVLTEDGARQAWRTASSPIFLPDNDFSPYITPDSVIVITGGARGVTAACARALALAFRPRIALVGTTRLIDEPPGLGDARSAAQLRAALVARAVRTGDRPRPGEIEAQLKRVLAVREIRATLADVASAGSRVRYLCADVGDAEAMRAALDEVRGEWGAVAGVVHGAGVLADRLVADKSDDQFDRVLRVKAEGLRNVLELVEADDPALVCVFSSVTAGEGNPGQCDYAAANAIAERLAAEWKERHPACVVRAIAWGPWDGGMVSPELAAMFAEREMALIPLPAGAEAFVAELAAGAASPESRCLITAGTGGHVPFPRGGEIAVSEVSQVWLADHRIGGRAIVPLAVVCDWMLRLVDSAGPVALADFGVLRGITAPAVVTVRKSVVDGGFAFTASTSGSDGRAAACYRARLSKVVEPLPPAGRPGLSEAFDTHDHVSEIYDGSTLFHGTALRTLRRVDSLGLAGASGSVVGVPDMDWPEEPWRTDPAALDGAIQLAVFWAKAQIGCATLPMSFHSGRFLAAGLEPGPLRCHVSAVQVGAQSAVCDVRLSRADGTLVAALYGLELVARPS